MERFYKKIKEKLAPIIGLITGILLFTNGMLFYDWLETLTDLNTATIWGNVIVMFLLLEIIVSGLLILRSKENG